MNIAFREISFVSLAIIFYYTRRLYIIFFWLGLELFLLLDFIMVLWWMEGMVDTSFVQNFFILLYLVKLARHSFY